MNATSTPSTRLDNVVHIDSDGDTDRLARIALSVCADAHGEVVVQANTYGILPTLRVMATDQPHPDGVRIPATALVGRLTKSGLLRTMQLGAECGMRVITPADAEWPARLADLGPGQPLALWVLGNTTALEGGCDVVALTGARNATTYGGHVACALAVDLAQRGRVIVSGAGYGIDEAAHRAAQSVPAPTIAVSSGGLDRPRPAGNADLLRGIVESGGAVISEQPPGTPPSRARAMRASQLVAAIASATVVVEASARSTALHAAHEAIRLGRAVGAVPGPVTSQVSAGCHLLVQEGKTALITDADDIIAMIASRTG